ncbi:MAG: ATP-binding protein [Deltaproteobacteria bacterium]
MGPPGTGKTLFAQALAHHWQIPYCNLQMTFLSRFLGSSERNLERILRMLIDFGGPIIFHLDELSRLFGAVQADSHEVTRRIVAMLLNFLESTDSSHVYTIGTMNTLELDAALLRRFDDVFYVSLPDKSQRKELFEYFARKYGVRIPDDNSVYTISHGMVGSEIERTVKDLKIESMSKGTEPSSLDLMRILRNRPALTTLFSGLQEIEEMALQAGFRLASPRTKELADAEFRNSK